jgi:uncharacterized protein YjiS (DUF1127 family)
MNTFAIENRPNAYPCHPVARHGEHINIDESVIRIFKRAFADFRAYLKCKRQRRIDRQAFQHLIALEDPILKDIGITRADVIWASKLPLSQNAATELEKIARQNRRV